MWGLLEPLLSGRKGTWGGNARDNRKFINVVFWILRTGAPGRDLPPDYGNWDNVNRRFCRWRDKGVWETILEKLIDNPDYEWLMIDASHIKAHRHACGAAGGNQDKIHLAVDAHGILLRILVTAGITADCTQACRLIEGIDADYLLADRGYDREEVVRKAQETGMTPVIPPRRNCKEQREYDKYLYRHRHLVGNAFLQLKRWRGIATRYAKYTASFVADVQIRCIAIWVSILA